MVDPIDSDKNINQFKDYKDVAAILSVMNCIPYLLDSDSWKQASFTLTSLASLLQVSNWGGSTMNVISKSAVATFYFKPEPHPQPFKFAWVYCTSLLVTHLCLVPLKLGSFFLENIYYDVLPMDITHILLRYLWLYNDVKHFKRNYLRVCS